MSSRKIAHSVAFLLLVMSHARGSASIIGLTCSSDIFIAAVILFRKAGILTIGGVALRLFRTNNREAV